MVFDLEIIRQQLEEAGFADQAWELGLLIQSFKNEGVPDKLSSDTSLKLPEILIKAKQGKYISEKALQEMLEKDKNLTQKQQMQVLEALAHIQQYGSESLYHLNLPARALYALRRAQLNTISEIKDSLQQLGTEGLMLIRGLGNKSIRSLIFCLNKFEAEE